MKRLIPSLAFVATAAGMLAGCPGTPATTTYTPITGIVIRGASLVAGHGCGTGPGQVYKYAAILTYVDEAGIPDTGYTQYSGVFDCYADGLFSNLPVDPNNGSLSFTVAIVAWNKDSFPADLQCEPCDDVEAGLTTCPGQAVNFTKCPGDTVVNVQDDQGTATWQTSCSATQLSGVSALTVCDPLMLTGSGDAGAGDASDAPPGP